MARAFCKKYMLSVNHPLPLGITAEQMFMTVIADTELTLAGNIEFEVWEEFAGDGA
jgi:hypothetical protein